MFIVNNSLYLSISNQVSYKEKKYGRWIPRNSLPFIWHENLDYFLEVCQEAINSFIDDCKEDSFEDLDEIRLDYLYKLNFPDANILAKKIQIVMEGFGHFIKDRDGYYYNSVEDFLSHANLKVM